MMLICWKLVEEEGGTNLELEFLKHLADGISFGGGLAENNHD